MDVTKNNLLILDAIFADSTSEENCTDFEDYASDEKNITIVDRETITGGVPLFRHLENRRPKENDLQIEFLGELEPLTLTIRTVNA